MLKMYLIIFFVLLVIFPSQVLFFEQTNYSEIIWIKIPSGKFIFSFSNDTTEIEYDFYISETEITNNQYLSYLNNSLKQNKLKIKGNTIIGFFEGDSVWKKGYYSFMYFKDIEDCPDIFRVKGEKIFLTNNAFWGNHPVRNVTWFGANDFAKYYGYKLPTNEEWEKAARGLSQRLYPWGDTLSSKYANYFKSGDPFDNGTVPVKYFDGKDKNNFQTKDNSSIYGIYDMIGNVSEWTGTYSKYYPKYKIYRGGCWLNKKEDLTNYLTSEAGPTLATECLGFRCVKN